jgi:transcriptional regulator with XRE-family HTH domain
MNGTQAARLGRLLAQARRNKGLSLRAAAHQARVDFAWLSRLEQGRYQQPAPERLTRIAEALGIDPERIDRVTQGHVSGSLPGVRTYFRSKYELTGEEIDEIERVVDDIKRKHERGNRDTNRNKKNSD